MKKVNVIRIILFAYTPTLPHSPEFFFLFCHSDHKCIYSAVEVSGVFGGKALPGPSEGAYSAPRPSVCPGRRHPSSLLFILGIFSIWMSAP